MSNRSTSKCLVCNCNITKCSSGSGGGNTLSSSVNTTQQQFNRHLDVIFVLRNILELPVHHLTSHLRNNWDIHEWISLCEKCSELVVQCRGIYNQLLRISKKFKACQLNVIKILKESDGESTYSRGADDAGDRSGTTRKRRKGNHNFGEETRNFVSNHDYEHLIDPVERMKAWAYRKEEKSESTQQNDEDLILIAEAIFKTELESEDETFHANSAEEEAQDPMRMLDDDVGDGDDDGINEGEAEECWSHQVRSDDNNDSNNERKQKEPADNQSSSQIEIQQTVLTADKIAEADARSDQTVGTLTTTRMDHLTGSKLFVCPLCRRYKSPITFEKSFFICLHLQICGKRCGGKRTRIRRNRPSELICRFCSMYSFPLHDISGFVNHLVSCTNKPRSTPLRYRIFQCDICQGHGTKKNSAFFTLDDFIRHYCYHTALIYKCTECSELFLCAEKERCLFHWRRYHSDLLSSVSKNGSLHTKLASPICPAVPWWCPKCGDVFTEEYERDAHIRFIHPSSEEDLKQVKCQFCGKFYCCSDELKLHHGTVHMLETNKLIQCDKCSDVFLDKWDIPLHRRRHHKLDMLECSICKAEFIEKSALRLHLKTMHPQESRVREVETEERTFKCHICCKEFGTLALLRGHSRKIHHSSAFKFVCHVKECGKFYKYKHNFKKHVAAAHGNKTQNSCWEDKCQAERRGNFICELCSVIFRGPRALKLHMKREHGIGRKAGKALKPNVQEAFQSPSRAEEEQKKNIAAATSTAKETASVVASGSEHQESIIQEFSEGNREPHMETDPKETQEKSATVPVTKEKPKFQCGECGKIVSTKFRLETHVKSHQRQRDRSQSGKCICEICGKALAGKQQLKAHQLNSISCKLLHMTKEEATLVCHLCGGRYSSKTNLELHIRQRHERIFKATCPQCGQGFPSVVTMKRHLAAVHKMGEYYENKEQFKCPVEGCDKILFSTRWRKRHMAQHAGVPEYKCRVCGKAFYCTTYRLQHEKLVHTGLTYYGKKRKSRQQQVYNSFIEHLYFLNG